MFKELETKPIFFGQAPSEEYQNYALTAFSYEDVNTEKVDKYEKAGGEITEELRENLLFYQM